MKLVHVAQTVPEATMIVADLESQGIQAEVRNAELAGLRGEIGLGVDTAPQVWVFDEADAERALEIVRSYLDEVDSSAPGKAWVCSACGEENDGNFALCWKCETAKP